MYRWHAFLPLVSFYYDYLTLSENIPLTSLNVNSLLAGLISLKAKCSAAQQID